MDERLNSPLVRSVALFWGIIGMAMCVGAAIWMGVEFRSIDGGWWKAALIIGLLTFGAMISQVTALVRKDKLKVELKE